MQTKVTGAVDESDMALALLAFLRLEVLLAEAFRDVELGADRFVLLVFAGNQELPRGKYPVAGRAKAHDWQTGQTFSDLTVRIRFGEDIKASPDPDHLARRLAAHLRHDLEQALQEKRISTSMRGAMAVVTEALRRAFGETLRPSEA